MTAVRWSRPEPFGAWVRFDETTLIALDSEHCSALSLPSHSLPACDGPRPLELHIATGSRCPAACEGCYIDARPDGLERGFEEICEVLRWAKDQGVAIVAFGGGEPLMRADIGRLAEYARSLGLLPVSTTSGIGLSRERVRELSAFAQINVSHDGIGGAYKAVRGFDGSEISERALTLIAAQGIRAGINLVLTRHSFESVLETAEHMAKLGASELQLLRYKPQGRAVHPNYTDKRLSSEQRARLWPLIEALAHKRLLRIRIDCAMLSLLSDALIQTLGHRVKTLAALGIFGCEAGRYLGGVRPDGSLAPCSFLGAQDSQSHAPRPLPLLGAGLQKNSASESLDPTHSALRAYHENLPEPCGTCELRSVCRGGCQVVSMHTHKERAFAPDPECPRVERHDQGLCAQ